MKSVCNLDAPIHLSPQLAGRKTVFERERRKRFDAPDDVVSHAQQKVEPRANPGLGLKGVSRRKIKAIAPLLDAVSMVLADKSAYMGAKLTTTQLHAKCLATARTPYRAR